jgi:apolipoprotein N-acyltransferase
VLAWVQRGAWTRALACVLSGVLAALAFPPWGLWPVAWVALVPWGLAVKGQSPVGAGLLTGLTGWVAAALAGHFLALPLLHVYRFPAWAAGGLLGGVVTYIALFYVVAGLVVGFLGRRGTPCPVAWVPCAWVGMELVRARLGGFPWLHVGDAQVAALPVVQVADLLGACGVSFVVVMANVGVVEAVVARRWRPLLVPGVVVVVALGYGTVRLHALDRDEPPPRWRVALVQPNIPQARKWERDFFVESMRRLHRLTAEGVSAGPVDVVVWPETALTADVTGARNLLEPVTGLLGPSGARLVVGAPRVVGDGAGRRAMNSAAVVEPDGSVSALYDRRVLVPLGEYQPAWVRWVPGLPEALSAHMGSFHFTPGSGVGDGLLEVGGVRASVTICFESSFPGLVSRAVGRGAQVLVNITNDAWFERSGGPRQYLDAARMRAVEHRLALVRAGNTGISAVVDRTGRVVASLGLDEEGVLRGQVPVGPAPFSLYTRLGDAPLVLLLLGLLAWAGTRRRGDGAVTGTRG